MTDKQPEILFKKPLESSTENRDSAQAFSQEVLMEVSNQNLELRERWFEVIGSYWFINLSVLIFFIFVLTVLSSAALEIFGILNTNIWTGVAASLISFIIGRVSFLSSDRGK